MFLFYFIEITKYFLNLNNQRLLSSTFGLSTKNITEHHNCSNNPENY